MNLVAGLRMGIYQDWLSTNQFLIQAGSDPIQIECHIITTVIKKLI